MHIPSSNRASRRRAVSASLFGLVAAGLPGVAQACACGCGVFDVGANSLMPVQTDSGVEVWLRYSYMDQNQNFRGGSKAPAFLNGDKDLATSFYTPGGEWVINPNWTVMAELPIYQRRLKTTDDGTVFGDAGTLYTGHLLALGDLETTVTYTGFRPDRSTGITFGMKFPTGDFRGPIGPLGGAELDRDSLPGTGSTDVIFGAYHVGTLNFAPQVTYFAQIKYQAAIATQDDYRPGNELDAAVGASYSLDGSGPLTNAAPTLQFIESYRLHDTGAEADPPNSGYQRLFIAPGIDLRFDRVRIYADAEIPLEQYARAAPLPADTSGQLVASPLLKLQVSYDF